MINAVKKAKNKGIKNIIIFTGFDINNSLRKVVKI